MWFYNVSTDGIPYESMTGARAIDARRMASIAPADEAQLSSNASLAILI